MRVLLVLLMLVPCVSLITLVIVNSQATTLLNQAGLKVGLLGVSAATLAQIDNLPRRSCPTCGEKIAATDAICPMCGERLALT